MMCRGSGGLPSVHILQEFYTVLTVVCYSFSRLSFYSVCTYTITVWVILDCLCIIRVKLRRTFILTKEENRRKRGYLEGEYGVWARHRLAFAQFLFYLLFFFYIIIKIYYAQ